MPRTERDRDKAFFGHPAGLSTLFFTEMWERFSYYGMRAFLIFYMTKPVAEGARGMSRESAGIVLALYLSSVYLLSLPGGWIADRFLGQRRAVTIGGIGIAIGNALLALPMDGGFYPGLILVALGTGLLKPNVSTIVGQLYSAEDPRRESGFTIYYMGINIGAGIAPLICGFLAQSDSFRDTLASHGIEAMWCWKIAFGVVALGMVAGLIQYTLGQPRLGEAGAHPTIPSDPKVASRDRTVLYAIVGGLVVVGGVFAMLSGRLSQDTIGDIFGVGLAIIAIALFAGLFTQARDAGERKRVVAMIPLFVGAIAFFGLSEQASSTLNLYADDMTHRQVLGLDIPASYYQSVNSVFIVLLAPAFAWLWFRLVRIGKEPSSVAKFAYGMVFIAIAYAVMLPTLSTVVPRKDYTTMLGGIPLFGDIVRGTDVDRVSGGYLVALYFFTTMSEMCISPVGLSSMSKLAPARLAGMVMGTWFLGTAIGNYLAGRAAGFTESRGYDFLFITLVIAALVIAAALFAVAPAIKKLLRSGEPELPRAEVVSLGVEPGE